MGEGLGKVEGYKWGYSEGSKPQVPVTPGASFTSDFSKFCLKPQYLGFLSLEVEKDLPI